MIFPVGRGGGGGEAGAGAGWCFYPTHRFMYFKILFKPVVQKSSNVFTFFEKLFVRFY